MNNTTSELINDLSAALSKAQGEMTNAVHDKVNPHFKSRYASLNSVLDACRPHLSKHGLAVMQNLGVQGDYYTLTTTLSHSSGQWSRSCAPVCSIKCNPQQVGSALTYFRRYALSAIVGISSDDDEDGNIAQEASKQQTSSTAKVVKFEMTDPSQHIRENRPVEKDASLPQPLVSTDQLIVLEELFSQTDELFKKNFTARLSNTYKSTELKCIPAAHFEFSCNAMKANIGKVKE